MTHAPPRRNFPHRLLMSAALAVTLAGCVSDDTGDIQLYPGPRRLVADSAILSVTAPHEVISVDGQPLPAPPLFYNYSQGVRLLLLPGRHEVEVRYDDGHRKSTGAPRLVFQAVAGHTYEMRFDIRLQKQTWDAWVDAGANPELWFPQIYDLNTQRVVPTYDARRVPPPAK